MNRGKLNKKANDYISNAGFGRGTNITLHALKCMMVDFYLDNQVKKLTIPDVSNQRELLLDFAGWLYGNLDKEVEERIVDDYLKSK